jgi:hypothetical protein
MTGVQTQIRRRGAAFAIRISGLIWHLNFGICNCADRVAPARPALKNRWQATKRIVRILTTESDDLTYKKELLNFGKNGRFSETNHSQLRRISSPAFTVRNNRWQAGETNPASLGAKCGRANRPTYEEEQRRAGKQTILTKRITPPSLVLFRHRQEGKGGGGTGYGPALALLFRQVG